MDEDKKEHQEDDYLREIRESLTEYSVDEFDEQKYMDILLVSDEEGIGAEEFGDVDDEFVTAVAEGNLALCTELIDRVIDIDMANHEGDTSLLVSIKAKRFEIARLLVISGASIYEKDSAGKAAIDYAKELYSEGENLELYPLMRARG